MLQIFSFAVILIRISVTANPILSPPTSSSNFDLDFNFQNGEIIPNTFSWKSKEILTERKFITENDDVEYRLPNNSIPLRYDLFLSTDVDKAIFDFNGRVKIRIKILEATQFIHLHKRQLIIDNISLLPTNEITEVRNLSSDYNEVNEMLQITLPEEMAINSELVLDISYHGVLREDNAGFYRSSYVDSNNNTRYIATTQFSMTDARHSMPCFDEPGIRAVVGVEIQHNVNYKALSNMPVISIEPIDNSDYVITKFADTLELQTYILGFIVCDYDYISSFNEDLDITQSVYAKKDAIDAGEGDFTLSVVHPVMLSLREYLNVSLPISKMDHVFITNFQFNAMENDGLITYRESNILYIEGRDDIEMKKRIVEVVSHEIAHHYFGNMVNIKWWSFTWLKEGFARLFQFYTSSLVFPEDDYIERFHKNAQGAAFRFDTIANDAKSLNFYVETPVNIRAKFNTISYDKGACFLRMMQMTMTIPTFAKALKYYLNDMYFKAATPQDVHRNFQAAYDEDFPDNGVDLEQVMTTWEEQAGYPLVNVERTGTTIILTQTRFGGGDEIYAIPISYTIKSNPNFNDMTPKLWMSEKTSTINDIPEDDWIVINLGVNGYYKVNYEKNNFEKIINEIKNNHETIPAVHRRQMFIDMNPQDYELLDVLQIFELMTYLPMERDAFVWDAVENIEGIVSKYLLGSEVIAEFQHFVQSLLEPHLTNLGFEGKSSDEPKEVELRRVVTALSCATLDDNCLDYEHERLLRFIETDSGTFNLCAALRKADEETHLIMVKRMETTDKELIAGLGCSLNAEILKNYLNIVLTPLNGLSKLERSAILQYTMGQSVLGLNAVFNLFTIAENFNDLRQTIPDEFKAVTAAMSNYVNTGEQREVFSSILDMLKMENFLSDDEAQERLDKVDENSDWLDENLEKVKNWLENYRKNETEGTTTTPTTSTEIPSTTGGSISSSGVCLYIFSICYILIVKFK